MVISLTIRPTNRVLKGSPSTLESPLGSPAILTVKQKVEVPVKKIWQGENCVLSPHID